jgi:hypothetical protein
MYETLEARGYEPTGDALDSPLGITSEMFDLVVSGTGTLRVVIYPRDAYRTELHAFDCYMVNRYSAVFSPGTPDAIVIGALDAAEDELAAVRGGPVTSRQES